MLNIKRKSIKGNLLNYLLDFEEASLVSKFVKRPFTSY
jgi:hypothetical protein